MDYFKKLPNYVRSPAGLEWRLFKKLPRYFLAGISLPSLIILALYLNNTALSNEQLKTIYLCLGLIFSVWFFVGAAAIGCIVVMIMKGPAYVADAYERPIEDKRLEEDKS